MAAAAATDVEKEKEEEDVSCLTPQCLHILQSKLAISLESFADYVVADGQRGQTS